MKLHQQTKRKSSLLFSSPIMLASLLGIVGLIVVVGIVGRSRGGSTTLPGAGDLETVTSVQTTSAPVKERVVSERFLVICPFCGAKNEQALVVAKAAELSSSSAAMGWSD